MRRFAPLLTVLALLAALCGAPLVHVHQAEEDEYHEHHSALLHAHSEHFTLHHHDDGVEISDHDEHHAARYLDLFQAQIASAPALVFVVSRAVDIEEPDASRLSRPLPDSRSHDPPLARDIVPRGPPA